MPQIRLHKLRRRLGLSQAAATPAATDPASIRRRRMVFETLPDYPACPKGWTTGAPDFVIFGAQKSGTTWWFRLIEQHPGVVQPKNQRPEVHYFDRLWAEWPDEAAISRYHRYFPRPAGKLIGEKTPEYLSCPWAPPMVKLAAPDAKAIVLLRDPVERYVSGMSHMDRGGLMDEEDDDGVVRVLGDRMRVVTDAISRGLYATQIEWLLKSYSADRLLVLSYEACVADAAGQLARTIDFLGLSPFELPAEELERPRNKSNVDKVAVSAEHLQLLRDYYRPDVERLRALVPELDTSLWRNYRDLD